MTHSDLSERWKKKKSAHPRSAPTLALDLAPIDSSCSRVVFGIRCSCPCYTKILYSDIIFFCVVVELIWELRRNILWGI